MKICCFTGHRDISADASALHYLLQQKTVELARSGVIEFRTGGALGFDTLAALAVLSARERFPDIRLVLMIPCPDQSRRWNDCEKHTYDWIRQQADEEILISDHYFTGCMQKRNRALVDGSDLCIAYLKKKSGGSHMTVRYAIQNQVEVINLGELL